jgi:hypothetical protein
MKMYEGGSSEASPGLWGFSPRNRRLKPTHDTKDMLRNYWYPGNLSGDWIITKRF